MWNLYAGYLMYIGVTSLRVVTFLFSLFTQSVSKRNRNCVNGELIIRLKYQRDFAVDWLSGYRRFETPQCHHVKVQALLLDCLILQMEEIRCSETSAII